MLHTTFLNSPEQNNYVPPCSEFTEFANFLKESRKITDDNLILVLNKTNGTLEQCADVWKQLIAIHEQRWNHIQNCMHELQTRIVSLEENSRKSSENNLNSSISHLTAFQEKNQLARLRGELKVEEILQDQALKLFKTKCKGLQPQLPCFSDCSIRQ